MKQKFHLWYLLTVSVMLAAVGCAKEEQEDLKPEDEVNKITFELNVSNILPHGADMEIIPSDKNRTYIYDVAPLEEFEKLSQEEIIKSLIEGISVDDLSKGDTFLSGTEMDDEEVLKEDSKYILVALGYEDGKIISELFTRKFKTSKAKPKDGYPNIEIDARYDPELQKIIFSMKCISKDAVKATNLASPSIGLDALLSEGYTLKELTDPSMEMARVLDEKLLALLNGEGLALELGVDDGVEPDMDVACVLSAWNEEGKRTTVRKDIKFEGSAKPEVRLTGNFDEETQIVTFEMECLSKNATYAASLLVETDELEQILAKGYTLPQIMNPENNDQVNVFTEDDVQQLNSGKVVFTIEKIVPGLSYSFVLEVKNDGGARTIKRNDIIAGGINPDPGEGPELETSGAYDAATEEVIFDTKCTSNDVSVGSTLIFKKELLDEFIQSIPLSELMLPTIGFAVKMTPEELEMFNAEGLKFTAGVKDGFEPGDIISFVVYGKNSANLYTIQRVDVEFEAEWKTHSGPIELDFRAEAGDGYGNDTDKSICVKAQCISQNADNAAILLTNTEELQKVLESGKTLEEVLDENRGSSLMESWNYSWIQSMNSEDGIQLWMSVAPDRKYTLIFEVTNTDNKVIQTADVQTTKKEINEEDGETKVKEIDDKQFRELIWDFKNEEEWKFIGERPAVIDFYAVWCGPCKTMAPIMDRLSLSYDGQVDFYKVNTQIAVAATTKMMYDLKLNTKGSIPFFVFIDASGNITTAVGSMEEAKVREYIEAILGNETSTDRFMFRNPAEEFEYVLK